MKHPLNSFSFLICLVFFVAAFNNYYQFLKCFIFQYQLHRDTAEPVLRNARRRLLSDEPSISKSSTSPGVPTAKILPSVVRDHGDDVQEAASIDFDLRTDMFGELRQSRNLIHHMMSLSMLVRSMYY